MLLLLLSLLHPSLTLRQQPNILYIMADDLGYEDVGFQSSDIRTPNLDQLARQGVILENHYVMPQCSPTRTSFMTGRLAIKTGFWHGNIKPIQEWGLGLEETLMPQMLKNYGYRTHCVGKWHLGMYTYHHTPIFRGFDTFLGMYLGSGDYFKHENRGAYDLRSNWKMGDNRNGFKDKVLVDMKDVYSTDIYTNRTIELLEEHAQSTDTSPFFIYLSYQTPHGPYQAPRGSLKQYTKMMKTNTLARKVYATMISIMDKGIGRVYESLEQLGLRENTIVVFSSDNGGVVNGPSSNYPLRGGKTGLFEGGIRGVSFVNSDLLKRRAYINTNIHHITDWYPTFEHLARSGTGYKAPPLLTVYQPDGLNIWNSLTLGIPCRHEVMLHLHIARLCEMCKTKEEEEEEETNMARAIEQGLEGQVGIEKKGKVRKVVQKSKMKKICGKTKSGRVKCFYKGDQYAVNKGNIVDQVFGKIFQHKDDLSAKMKSDVSEKGEELSNQSVVLKEPETGTEEIDEDEEVGEGVIKVGEDGTEELDEENDEVIGEIEEDSIEETVEETISENGTEVIDEDISAETKVNISESVKSLSDVTIQFIQDYINKHHLNETDVDRFVSEYTNRTNNNNNNIINNNNTALSEEIGTEELDEDVKKEEADEENEKATGKEYEVIDKAVDGTEEIDGEEEEEEEEEEPTEKEEEATSGVYFPGFDPTTDLFVYRWNNWKLILGKIEEQKWTSHNGYKNAEQTPVEPNKRHAYLFELDSDSSERTNVADRFPFIVDLIAGKINNYINDVVVIKPKKISNRGRRSKVWKPWVKLRDLDKSLGRPLNLDKPRLVLRGGKRIRRNSNETLS